VPTAAIWRDTLLAVLAVSALPLAGMAVLAWREQAVRLAAPLLVCFAVGALLGAALFQLIPEAYDDAPGRGPLGGLRVPLLVALGYGTFHLLEWVLHTAHGHHDPARAAPGCAAHAGAGVVAGAAGRRRALVALNLLGDALHNLLDGMLIAATFLVDPAVGLLTTVAVSLHEVPRELGSFGVFVHAGVTARRALGYNVATGLLAVVGAVATLLVGARAAGVARALLPFAAGNFLFVAGSLLVPLLRRPGAPRVLALRAALVGLGLVATGVPALLH
jgi:zinc and cadmium transporter